MSKYTPEKLVAVSRYQNYFPTLPGDIQSDVYARIDELMEEEKQYCDKGKACFRSCQVSLPTSKMCKKAAFLLILFRTWNIIKRRLEVPNRRLPS